MNIQKLSNMDLFARMGKLVQTERKITHLILECIAEIDKRKLYLDRAYPSLYEFLVKEYGYSPAAAYRRMESARLLREVPEVSEKIQNGALNLTQLSQVQQAVRAVQKTEDRKVDTSEKREVLKDIEFANQKATELALAKKWTLPVLPYELEKINRDESVTLTIHLNKEEAELLDKVKNMVSHSAPNQKWSDVLVYLAKKELKARTPKKVAASVTKKANKLETKVGTESSVSPQKKSSSGVASLTDIKKTILNKGHCQYIDPITQNKCGSQKFLQVDHIYPLWAGGGNERSNLQVLCGQHNRHKYNREIHSLP